MPGRRWKNVFTPAELRRQLPRRADLLHRAVAAFLDASLTHGATWTFLADGGAVIVRLGRAHVLQFHVDPGQPYDRLAAFGENLERAGARVATVRDFAEITTCLTTWGLSRRPGAAA